MFTVEMSEAGDMCVHKGVGKVSYLSLGQSANSRLTKNLLHAVNDFISCFKV